MQPTKKEVNRLFEYIPSSGHLIWKIKPSKRIPTGSIAGSPIHRGYVKIKIKGLQILAHRLIWIYHNGEIPKNKQIDHIDCNPTNNRIDNLRLATPAQNAGNCKPRSKKGYPKGVQPNNGRYSARIKRNYKYYHLGLFDTPEEASKAYSDAATSHFGDFARP
jgi:hypothetical protein